jgi:hypothetical protein
VFPQFVQNAHGHVQGAFVEAAEAFVYEHRVQTPSRKGRPTTVWRKAIKSTL